LRTSSSRHLAVAGLSTELSSDFVSCEIKSVLLVSFRRPFEQKAGVGEYKACKYYNQLHVAME
jgi:hypothetical protein